MNFDLSVMSLFLPEVYRENQCNFLDSVIPELKENSVNLNTYDVIDDLISFLELPLDPILIPSEDIFHLLLTISSRSASCNWSADLSKPKHGLVETQEQKLASRQSEQLLHNSTLSDRCIHILKKYKHLVYAGNEDAYNVLQPTINHLVTKESSRQRSSSVRTVFKAVEQPLTPTKRGKRSVKRRRHDESIVEESSDMVVITDSEEEEEEEEDGEGNESKDPEYNPLQVDSFGSNSYTDSCKNSSQTNDKLTEPWAGLRVFDEPLLKDQFRLTNGRFGVWDLVNWTFYCAGLSTKYYYKKESNCHTIYKAQSSTLLFIFDIIEYNLVNTLQDIFKEKDPYATLFKTPSDKNKFASLQVEDNSNILLLRLLKSLGYLQSQWYDRVVEFVFNGLARLPPCPRACYQHESILVRRELKKNSRDVPKEEKVHCDTDNMDSMCLRFKICAIVYYWSLVFDKRVFSGKSFGRNSLAQLNALELIKFVCEKFKRVDYQYIVEFYYSLYTVSVIPFKYKQLFLMGLSTELLKTLTSSPESIKFELHNLDLVVSWIDDPSIYAQLTEDESCNSFEEFYQSWMKLSFVLKWILTLTLADLQDVGNSIYKDTMFYDKLEHADRLRATAFVDYLHSVSESKETSNFKFELSDNSVTFVKENRMTWEPFTSILSNYT